jgi:hypothetical protein
MYPQPKSKTATRLFLVIMSGAEYHISNAKYSICFLEKYALKVKPLEREKIKTSI